MHKPHQVPRPPFIFPLHCTSACSLWSLPSSPSRFVDNGDHFIMIQDHDTGVFFFSFLGLGGKLNRSCENGPTCLHVSVVCVLPCLYMWEPLITGHHTMGGAMIIKSYTHLIRHVWTIIISDVPMFYYHMCTCPS